MDRILTMDRAGELLNTGPRFVRRLITEHRIEFVHVGRRVRIAESALARFVEAREPVSYDDGIHIHATCRA
jgi:excisionase family DNA binding protein